MRNPLCWELNHKRPNVLVFNLCENINSTELLALKSTVAAGMLLIPRTIVFCCLEDAKYMNIYAVTSRKFTPLAAFRSR